MAAPTSPPIQLSGRDAATLTGPSEPGSRVICRTTDNLYTLTQTNPAGTSFWLEPGRHLLDQTQFGQVIPKAGNSYYGAPGAILDGNGINRYAFTGTAANVTIRYLTVQGFVCPRSEGVVNHDGGPGWKIQYCKVWRNGGAGVFLGDDGLVSHCLLTQNSQYGFQSVTHSNVTVEYNEVSFNNADDWEIFEPGCGCTGACKFWDTRGAIVRHNWIHSNFSVGLWADTNNVGFDVYGNYINDNTDEGIFYEISYNARIVENTLIRNALRKGRQFYDRGDTFPITAIYLSEAGGDSRVNAGVFSTLEVKRNVLIDNWGYLTCWENADRFGHDDSANTSKTYTTLVSGGMANCSQANIATPPNTANCRWKTQNVRVEDNDFELVRARVGIPADARAGRCAIISNFGTFPSWSPYNGTVVQDAIINQNNVWASNRYKGSPPVFLRREITNELSLAQWQAVGQDIGSTLT